MRCCLVTLDSLWLRCLRESSYSHTITENIAVFHSSNCPLRFWKQKPNNWWCVCAHTESLSRVRLFATPWTVVPQAPLSMGFSRQEYWSTLPFPSPRDLPDPGSFLFLLHWRVDSLPLSHLGSPVTNYVLYIFLAVFMMLLFAI